MTENAERVAAHPVAITKPIEPGGPYVITCPCGFVAEASYPTAALVGAYSHKGSEQGAAVASAQMFCEDCEFSTDVIYDAAAHTYAHDGDHRTVDRALRYDGI